MEIEPPQPEKDIKMDALCELTAKTQCPNLGEYNKVQHKELYYF